jgi:hypothetical protein
MTFTIEPIFKLRSTDPQRFSLVITSWDAECAQQIEQHADRYAWIEIQECDLPVGAFESVTSDRPLTIMACGKRVTTLAGLASRSLCVKHLHVRNVAPGALATVPFDRLTGLWSVAIDYLDAEALPHLAGASLLRLDIDRVDPAVNSLVFPGMAQLEIVVCRSLGRTGGLEFPDAIRLRHLYLRNGRRLRSVRLHPEVALDFLVLSLVPNHIVPGLSAYAIKKVAVHGKVCLPDLVAAQKAFPRSLVTWDRSM